MGPEDDEDEDDRKEPLPNFGGVMWFLYGLFLVKFSMMIFIERLSLNS